MGATNDDIADSIRSLMRAQREIDNLKSMGLDKNKAGKLSEQAKGIIANRQEALSRMFQGMKKSGGGGGSPGRGMGQGGSGGGGFLKRTK